MLPPGLANLWKGTPREPTAVLPLNLQFNTFAVFVKKIIMINMIIHYNRSSEISETSGKRALMERKKNREAFSRTCLARAFGWESGLKK